MVQGSKLKVGFTIILSLRKLKGERTNGTLKNLMYPLRFLIPKSLSGIRHPLSTIRHPELLTASAVGVMKDPPEQRNKPLVLEKPNPHQEGKTQSDYQGVALMDK